MSFSNTIHVVSSTDDNYVPHLGVMFVSLLESTQKDRKVQLYVLNGGITEKNKQWLQNTVAPYQTSIQFLDVDPKQYENAVESRHITKASYYRISIPDLISDTEIEKVLYIDSDTVVLEDVSTIYDQDISPNIAAAVIDCGLHDRLETLGVSKDANYFNAGIMLIDLNSWRENKITQRAFDYIKHATDEQLEYHDQDILNTLLCNKWLELHPKWNAQAYLLLKQRKLEFIDEIKKQEASSKPAIVHFCGEEKPWLKGYVHPYKKTYYHFLAKTASGLERGASARNF